VLVAQAFIQLVGDGLEMRFAGAGTNQEEIGERRELAQIDGDDVLGFFVGGYCSGELGEFCGVDGREGLDW